MSLPVKSVALAFIAAVVAAPSPKMSSNSSAPPFTPTGGQGLNSTPVYQPMSDFDYQSFALGLNQEYLELALFNDALKKFSDEEWAAAGLDADDVYLIQYMAGQEIGHVDVITNILGGPANAPQSCNYSFPYDTVEDFITLSAAITQAGESGVYGFLQHLDSRAAGDVLGQTVAVEGRQQMIFRQFSGLFPMPFWFVPAITQSMAWTLQSMFTTHCPPTNPHFVWQNFPGLNVTNAPNGTVLPNGTLAQPAISVNRTSLSSPGLQLNLTWENPGKKVGPDLNYTTSITAGAPKFVAWVSQLNVTYSPLTNISGNSGLTSQPDTNVFGGDTAPTNNGTIFVLLTDSDTYVTPFNISQLNQHVVAGPSPYTAG